MADEEAAKGEGYDLLDKVWFDTIDALQEIVVMSDDISKRIEAADVLLRYFVSMGQSINAPYVPEERYIIDDDEDDDD
jgi:hypothetical protein